MFYKIKALEKNFLWYFPDKEKKLLIFFFLIVFIFLVRLFVLQVVSADFYYKILHNQHYSNSSLDASRGNIYINNDSGKGMQLTKNVNLYNIFVDPKFIKDKQKLIDLLSPLIYNHLCEINWIRKISNTWDCIRNVEDFTNKQIFYKEAEKFYLSGSNKILEWEKKEDNKENQKIIKNFSNEKAIKLIKEKLDEKIKFWKARFNYFWFFENPDILNFLGKYDFAEIKWNYVYFIPSKVNNINHYVQEIFGFLKDKWYFFSIDKIKDKLSESDIRYIKLVDWINSKIAQDIRKLKKEFHSEEIEGIPVLHWLWLEKEEKRFYPYGSFLSHILWYVNKSGNWIYWLEGFFDSQLNWKNWRIKWLSTPWIWTIWSNWINIEQPTNWNDIYLTIDPSLQKEVEKISKYYHKDLKSDSISVVVLNANNGEIKALSNYPDFNPNFYKDVYKIKPLTYENKEVVERKDYMDIPILISSWDNLRKASFEERDAPNTKKYIYKNLLWPQVFKDKNISFPYEPWSIFKAFTVAIGLDSDEISLYDFYKDDMKVQIGPYTIANVHSECEWEHNFLHSFEWSCNVGMVKIVEKIWRYVFYNYLKKIWFWNRTGIELEFEDSWKINALQKYSRARFFNNAFWQWIEVTPLQIAMWYAALVNGWYLIQPTVVEKIYDKESQTYIKHNKLVKDRVFTNSTSEKMRESLFKVMQDGWSQDLAISGFTLGGKTWTSQIAFKGKYQQWKGWTNWSFVGLITKENPEYIVVVQVRRPRKCQWWSCSAWKIFRDISKYILEYKWIRK